MADNSINIRLRGEAVEDGTIELERLLEFGDQLTRTLYVIADNLSDKKHKKKEKISLTLTEVHKGSFAMVFKPTPPLQTSFIKEFSETLTIRALEQLIDILYQVSSDAWSKVYDESHQVLETLKSFGQSTLGAGVEAIDFEFKSSKQDYFVTYNDETYVRLVNLIEETRIEERIRDVKGKLVMANFRGEDKFKCGIELDSGQYLSGVEFDEDLADLIKDALRQRIYAVGIAGVNTENNEIRSFRIKSILKITTQTSPQDLEDLFTEYKSEYDTLANFKQGWQEMLAGQGHHISQLWDDIDD
ncbi:MAG: hypothetical protein L0154_19935 [Chloroflexi bacterium]|nr:hypothetical protein [Chloroflexota bacterium]